MEYTKLFIAVPTYETIAPECFEAIFNLVNQWDVEMTFKAVKGYDCARARNEIVKQFLKSDYEWLWTIDSDTILPVEYLNMAPNFIDWFVMQRKPIVLGWYPRKNDPGRTEIFMEGYEGYPAAARWNCAELAQNVGQHFIPIKGGGFGCAIIHREVLETLEYPYFKYVSYDDGQFLSEDLYFCSKAREAGYQIWTMPALGCDHIGKRIIKAYNLV